MKMISVKVAKPDGTSKTVARPISDDNAMNEHAVQNAVDAAVRQERGTLVSHQIIDTDKPNVRETLIGPDDDAEVDKPVVGIQHADAVGIVDGEPSGGQADDPGGPVDPVGAGAAAGTIGWAEGQVDPFAGLDVSGDPDHDLADSEVDNGAETGKSKKKTK